MANRVQLNDRVYEREKTPGILWDTKVTGLGLRISPKGKRVFVLDYYAGLEHRRPKIGQFPAMTVEAARNRAMEIKAQVAKGEDPTARVLGVPTVRDYWTETYRPYPTSDFKRTKATTLDSYDNIMKVWVLPRLGDAKVNAVTYDDVNTDADRREPWKARQLPQLHISGRDEGNRPALALPELAQIQRIEVVATVPVLHKHLLERVPQPYRL